MAPLPDWWSHVPRPELQGRPPNPHRRPRGRCGLQRQGCSSAPKGGQHDLEGHTHSVGPAWPAPPMGARGARGPQPLLSTHVPSLSASFPSIRSRRRGGPSRPRRPPAATSVPRPLSRPLPLSSSSGSSSVPGCPRLCSLHLPSSVPFSSRLSHLLLPPRLTRASGVGRTVWFQNVLGLSVSMCPKLGPKQTLPACTVQSPLIRPLLQSALQTQYQEGPLACPLHWACRRGRRGFAC